MWNSAERLGIVRPSAAEWTLLILLGASLLALRTFRDSYLKIWVVGWAALLASHLAEHCLAAKFPAPFDQVVVHAAFVLAVGLLACAVLVYARMRDLILPLMVITPVLVGFAGARVLLWPDSVPLRVALEISYRFVLLTAAVSLLRARRGRWEPAAWLLAFDIAQLAALLFLTGGLQNPFSLLFLGPVLISATALLDRNPSPDEDEIRLALSGNLCRCTGYSGIVRAVQSAAGELAS